MVFSDDDKKDLIRAMYDAGAVTNYLEVRLSTLHALLSRLSAAEKLIDMRRDIPGWLEAYNAWCKSKGEAAK